MRLSRTKKDVNCLECIIKELIYDGAFTKIMVDVNGLEIKSMIIGTNWHYKKDDIAYVWWKPEDVTILGMELHEKE